MGNASEETKTVSQAELFQSFYRTLSAGLIAIIIVILTALIPIETGKYDIPEFICVFAFALALPILVVIGIMTIFYKQADRFDTDEMLVVASISSFLTFVGIAAVLFHVSWIASLLFVISALFSSIILMFPNYYKLRRKSN